MKCEQLFKNLVLFYLYEVAKTIPQLDKEFSDLSRQLLSKQEAKQTIWSMVMDNCDGGTVCDDVFNFELGSICGLSPKTDFDLTDYEELGFSRTTVEQIRPKALPKIKDAVLHRMNEGRDGKWLEVFALVLGPHINSLGRKVSDFQKDFGHSLNDADNAK
jgi:hypothetical protein